MLSFRKPISELLHVNEINHGCMKNKLRRCLANSDGTILQLFDDMGLEELNLIALFLGLQMNLREYYGRLKVNTRVIGHC